MYKTLWFKSGGLDAIKTPVSDDSTQKKGETQKHEA